MRAPATAVLSRRVRHGGARGRRVRFGSAARASTRAGTPHRRRGGGGGGGGGLLARSTRSASGRTATAHASTAASTRGRTASADAASRATRVVRAARSRTPSCETVRAASRSSTSSSRRHTSAVAPESRTVVRSCSVYTSTSLSCFSSSGAASTAESIAPRELTAATCARAKKNLPQRRAACSHRAACCARVTRRHHRRLLRHPRALRSRRLAGKGYALPVAVVLTILSIRAKPLATTAARARRLLLPPSRRNFPGRDRRRRAAAAAAARAEPVARARESGGARPADVAQAMGAQAALLRFDWPRVVGFDFSGVVEAAGADANFKVGERVFGMIRGLPQRDRGTLAELVLVDADVVARCPPRATARRVRGGAARRDHGGQDAARLGRLVEAPPPRQARASSSPAARAASARLRYSWRS